MNSFLKKIVVGIITAEARLVLRRHKPKIITVTGSVGKTSAKDAIYASLAAGPFFIRKSQKSFNSEIGVPLTVLGCENPWRNPFGWLKVFLGGLSAIFDSYYPDRLVLELGADRPGDIKNLVSWLKPDVAVITGFAEVPAHIEFFGSREDLLREKRFLSEAVPEGGLVVLNADDEDTLSFAGADGRELRTYGFSENADARALSWEAVYSCEDGELEGGFGFPTGIKIEFRANGRNFLLFVRGVIGKQHVYPVLAGFIVGAAEGVAPKKILRALKKAPKSPGRMRLIEGINGSSIIDDSYNSSPAAVREALEALKIIRAKRRMAVLGDMLELGRYSAEEHRKVGHSAARVCDALAAIGLRARGIAEGAFEAGMVGKDVFQFNDAREAGKFLRDFVGPGDVVLIKGSQAMRMERTVEEIMAHPERRVEILARQEEEWLKKE